MNSPAPAENNNVLSHFSSIEFAVKHDRDICVGIVTPDGIALLKVCRESSILVEKWSCPKIVNISDTLLMTFCGNEADFRVLADYAKKQSTRYHKIYTQPISTVMLMKEVSALVNQYTRMNSYRPFAASILLGCRGSLYNISPGGEVFQFDNKIYVMGEKSEQIAAALTRENLLSLPLDKAVDKCVSVLRHMACLQVGDIRVYRSNPTQAEAGQNFTTAVV
ncbi:hypothetical protein WDU94_004434 [Cyamophila willieti]